MLSLHSSTAKIKVRFNAEGYLILAHHDLSDKSDKIREDEFPSMKTMEGSQSSIPVLQLVNILLLPLVLSSIARRRLLHFNLIDRDMERKERKLIAVPLPVATLTR